MNDPGTDHGPSAAWLNVRDFGAAGDGKTDDTKAIRDALAALPEEAGVLLFPPGRYLTDTIRARSNSVMLGRSTWSYRRLGGTVLTPFRADQPCLIDANDRHGTHFVGLTLDGMDKGGEMHGIVARRDRRPGGEDVEMDLVIDRCNVTQFSGSGVRLTEAWAWHVRHSFFHGNALDGIDASGSYDAWILDNIFAGNERFGLNGDLLAAATITGNRVEWNHQGGIRIGPDYSDNVQITGNFFDACFGPAIWIEGRSHHCISVTGNTMRRSAYRCADRPDANCHMRFVNVRGLTVTGNSMVAGRVGRRRDQTNPAAGIIVEKLRDSVIAGNALHHGAMKQLIVDRGGHENLILRDNPGSLQDAEGVER